MAASRLKIQRVVRPMLIVGVTGSFGTGKTTVSKMFAQLGAYVINADYMTHQLMRYKGKCYGSIVKHFGRNILKGRDINRSKLGAIVFNNKRKLQALCRIIHPVIITEIKTKIKQRRYKGNKMIIIDAPLLIEAGLNKIVDYLIVVKANQNLQVERIQKNIPLSQTQILKRIKVQMPINKKIKLADFIINNGGGISNTQKQVRAIWKKLLKN